MRLWRRPLLFAVLAVTAMLLATTGCGDSNSSTGTEAEATKAAPDFSVKSLAGDNISLADYAGQPLVINFAASWCGPCEIEAPTIEKMYQKYKDRVGFIGIAVRDQEEDQRAFAQRHGLSFPIGLDPDGKVVYTYQKAGKVNLSGIPTTFFVDKEGNIAAFFIGPISERTFDQKVETILD